MFGRIMKTEARKALGNRWFVVALIIGCALAAASFIFTAQIVARETPWMTLELLSKKYTPLTSDSVFASWMVDDFARPSTDLFFLLLPLLAVVPFSWSLLVERTSGYAGHIIARSGRKQYLLAKLLAAFLAGGAVVAIPILLNFVACMCLFPFSYPDVAGVVTLGVYDESLWSWFFYNSPGLFCLFRFTLIFAFSGLWAAFVMSLSFVIRRRIPLLIAPYLGLILLKYLNEQILTVHFNVSQDLTPFGYLRSVPPAYFTSWWVIALEMAVLLLVVSGVFIKNRRMDTL